MKPRADIATWIATGLPVGVGIVVIAVFGNTWGEETNHAWYSAGASTGDRGLLPFLPNNYGKVLVFGNPVYDFAIATGARLPLQTGVGGTFLVLLRYVASMEVIATAMVAFLLVLSTLLLGRVLKTLGVASPWMTLAIHAAYVAIPVHYLTEFDWYTLATGFVCMSTLVFLLVLLIHESYFDCQRNKQKYVILGLTILFIGFPSSYISYLHVSTVALFVAIVVGRRKLIAKGIQASKRAIFLAPIALVSATTLSVTAWDLRVSGSSQEALARNTNATTLFSPIGGLSSLKHFLLQVLVGDWKGIIGFADAPARIAYSSANVPVTLFLSATVIAVLLDFNTRRNTDFRTRYDQIDLFLIGIIIAAIISLWWTPFPADLDVSDRNFYAHLGTLGSLLLISRMATRSQKAINKKSPGVLMTKTVHVTFMVAFITNAVLLVPESLRSTLDNRKETIAPNSLFSIAYREQEDVVKSTWVRQLPRSARVFSLTEAFDAHKYFQSELPGYVTYGDLTQQRIATINSYPKIRYAGNIATGSRYSSSLAPSSLGLEVGRYCPIEAAEFLGIRTLVLTALQRYYCESQSSVLKLQNSSYLGVRDGAVVLAIPLSHHPSFWSVSDPLNKSVCPIVVKTCWDSLGWQRDDESTVQINLDAGPGVDAALRINISRVSRRDAALVLPVSHDSQLRVSAQIEDEEVDLKVSSLNGFATVSPPQSASSLELTASIKPDPRMVTYGLLPYAWALAVITASLLWRRSRHHSVDK